MEDSPAAVPPERLATDLPLPETWRVDRLDPARGRSLDIAAAAADAVRRPLSSLPLPELAGPGSRVTIAWGGLHAGCPGAALLRAMVTSLRSAGVRREDITVLVAAPGLVPVTAASACEALGEEVGTVGRVVVNDPGDRAAHTALGGIDGLIVRAHHLAVEADLLVATGSVAPDEFAGYSGGADTVALGCADVDTQRALRSARFLDDAAVRAGKVQGNPYQRILREIGRRAGLLFIVNVVADPDTGEALAVAAGAPAAVHDALVAFAAGVYEPEAPGADYDVVVLAEDDRERRTLFEASGGISGSALGDRPVLRAQGIVIAQARCGANAADPASAGDFYDALAGATSADVLLRQLRGRSLRPGEERAFRLAQVLAGGARIVLWDSACDHSPGFGLSAARTLTEAAEIAESFIGRRPRALVVPLRGGRLPVPGDGEPENPFGAWGDDEP